MGRREGRREPAQAPRGLRKGLEVFFDPFVRLADAGRHGEAREAAIGLTEDWDLLFVVHMVRHPDAIHPHYLGPSGHALGKETL
jgi:hypothetical protein